MKNFIIVDKSNGAIVSSYRGESKVPFGGTYGNSDLYANLEVPAELDPKCISVNLEDMSIQADAEKLEDKIEETREEKLERIRQLRAPKLARVDQLVNIAVLNSWTAGEKTELKEYRQALLDITEDYKADMSELDSVDVEALAWPEEPSED